MVPLLFKIGVKTKSDQMEIEATTWPTPVLLNRYSWQLQVDPIYFAKFKWKHKCLIINFSRKILIYPTMSKVKVFGWLQCTVQGIVNSDYS
jgi:hypothetical protein